MDKTQFKDKKYFEQWYSKEDPWKSTNTISDRIRRAILLKHIEVVFSDGSRKSILDAGCGEGYIAKDIVSKYNADIDAFDISENALATARKRNYHENIHYFQLDLNDYVPKKEYDLIMCEEALYYLPDDIRDDILRNFHDSIRPGGYLKITAIIVGETPWRKYFTYDSIMELVVGNGFRLVSVLPSVIQRKGYAEKAFYRLLEYMNALKLVGPNLIKYLVELTLKRPLNKCRAISLLAIKV